MNNVNWREIDPETFGGARQLDRAVAEQLGWKIIPDPESPHLFAAENPQGEIVEYMLSEYGAENFWYMNHVPRYSTDANVALKLAEDIPDFVLMRFNPEKGWHAEQDSNSDFVYSNAMPTPALAIVYAWLRFKERQAADLR